MKKWMSILALCLAVSAALALEPPRQIAPRRKEQTDNATKRVTLWYQYDKGGEFVAPTTQAAQRGQEAAKAWGAYDKSKPIALLGRSPFGGGETGTTYWPAEVKPELILKLVEPLAKAGVKVELGDAIVTTRPVEVPEGITTQPAKPWAQLGFSEDYEFALLVGMHHEPIPFEGVRKRDETGKTAYFRGHRMNAWAILFHCPSGTACWGTTAVASVGHAGIEDPVNLGAETVLGYLDFADLGKDNISEYLEKLAYTKELPAVDIAAMLVQSQRADAVAAVVQAAMAESAYKTTAWVLRYFNEHGTAQDFRLSVDEARNSRLLLAAQRVMMRLLLLEQLRGMRSAQACVPTALVPLGDDIDLGVLGRECTGTAPPAGGDEEIVLMTELLTQDLRRVFRTAHVALGVRYLGRCRVHVDEAMAVARFFAERPTPPPQRGRPPERDELKEAGKEALAELRAAVEERRRKAALLSPTE